MATYPLRVGDRGRIVLPAALRRESGLSEGHELVAHVQDDGSIVLASRERLMDELRTACQRMGARPAVEELSASRADADADRLARLERPVIDPATAAQRGRTLLADLGIQ